LTQKRSTPRQKAQLYGSVKQVKPRNETQEKYLETIDDNIVTFGVGPAGTGKTYLAMFQAVTYLWAKKDTKRIVLTRPVVEAGERLGFLPGLLEDKMDPFMRPLYDSLYEMVGIQDARSKIANGSIEIAPIAFMRGRTFKDSFIILDEAQNCTYEQLKMVLTRLGENTKLVISGDMTQSDLNGKSGLGRIVDAVEDTNNVGVIRFGSQDVVRSEIVRDLLASIDRYEDDEKQKP
jgi:phosphate starvation-inducible PhoH-like protein